MTRTIKFRGKHLDTGEWMYGDVLHAQNYDPNTRTATKSENLIIVTGEVGERSYVADIIPNTLGQFTGLHDKDGREIYEGDIVEVTSMRVESYGQKMTCEIVYDEKMACYDFKAPDRQRNICVSILDVECKIIGNVHEHQTP